MLPAGPFVASTPEARGGVDSRVQESYATLARHSASRRFTRGLTMSRLAALTPRARPGSDGVYRRS